LNFCHQPKLFGKKLQLDFFWREMSQASEEDVGQQQGVKRDGGAEVPPRATTDGLLPVPPQFSVSTVIVTNISPLATEQNIRDFFSNCGKIVQLNLLG